MSQRPYVVGNWKMNGTRATLVEARAIDRGAARHPSVRVGIAPPFTLVQAMAEAVHDIEIGAQDCHTQASGAFTGDVSAPMIADCGAAFVILGHSERRSLHGEKDSLVKAKAEAALAAGLEVIVCVGETEAERDAGKAESVVAAQLKGSLPRLEGASARLTVAYEPVWAIGTGRVPSLDDVSTMHRAIRAHLVEMFDKEGAGVAILYGGSVNAGNASDLLRCDEVGGALVGGASLTAESFLAIVLAAAGPGEG